MNKRFIWLDQNDKVTGSSRHRYDGSQEEVDITDPRLQEFLVEGSPLSSAQVFVGNEMAWCDAYVNYHDDGDRRAVIPQAQIRTYRKALRDYVQGGVITTPRPERPTTT